MTCNKGRRMADALTRQIFFLLFFIMRSWKGWNPLLVSGLMGDGECQTQACVLINGTAPVLAAHPTNWSKTCKTSGTILHILHHSWSYFISRNSVSSNINCNWLITITTVKLYLLLLHKNVTLSCQQCLSVQNQEDSLRWAAEHSP